MNQLLSQLIFFVVSGVFIQEVLNVRLESDRLVPIRGEDLTLSCQTSISFDIGVIFWYKSTTKNLLSKCYPKRQGYCKQNESIYHFNANKTGAYIYIDGLDRTRDGGKWTCVHVVNTTNENDTKDITIYASPVSINIVQPITTKGDLGIETIILECQTANCSFPAPNITWHYMKDGQITPFSGFSVTNITDTSRCPQQEAMYTSTLHLPRGTNFSGNIPFTTKFLCGVTHQSLGSETKYSDTSNSVTFAVQVSIVSLANSAGRTKVFYEGFTQTLKCISSPSRPVPIIKWFIQAHHQQKELTDNITETDITDTNGLHVRTSEITLIMSRNHTDQNILCAGNIHSQPPVWSNTVKIDVLYAPDIHVTINGSNYQNMTSYVICQANGSPSNYTFHPWKHKLGNMTIRSSLHSNPEGNIHSGKNTWTLNRLTLQDMGSYVCSVDNGVKGVNGDVIQTGAAVLNVRGIPDVVHRKDDIFAGEIGSSLNMSIAFYSDPVIMNFTFLRNGSDIKNTSRTIMFISKDIVELMFHGTKIKLEVQTANLLIQNLTKDDFNNYTLLLKNSHGKTKFKAQLNSSGRPLMVDKFYYNRFIGGGIEFHFDPGFNGGRKQTFILEYRSASSYFWQNTSITDLQEEQTEYRLPNGTYFVNVTQPPSGYYIYRMYSVNNIGKSPYSLNVYVFIPQEIIGTGDEKNQCNQLILSVVVAMGTAIVALIVAVIALVIVILRKRSIFHKPQSGNTLEESEVPGYEVGRGVVPTGEHNAVSNEYEGLSNVRDREDPYQEMQDLSAENREVYSR